jgi:hypothetical protein
MRTYSKTFLCLMGVWTVAGTVSGQDTGAKGNGNWENAAIWTTGAVPGASNSVYIGSTYPNGAAATATVALTANDSAANVYLGNGNSTNGTLNLGGNTLTIGGSLVIGQNGGTGTLNAGGGSLAAATVTGPGQLGLNNGSTATLGSYTMNTGGGLTVDKTSLLQIAGDWSNQLKDPTQFQVNGTVELKGGGISATADAVQHIEVASHDFGNTVSAPAPAFTNNFSIGGTLQIDSGANVMLVDQFDNGNRGGSGSEIAPGLWTGSPTGSEAIYVADLVIQPDVTINFNGLHLYYEVGPSGGVGRDPSVWQQDLAIWQAQGDVFIGGEPLLIPMAASVPEPPGLVLAGAALCCLSAVAWCRSRRAPIGARSMAVRKRARTPSPPLHAPTSAGVLAQT